LLYANLRHFPPNKGGKYGLHSKCRSCARKYWREYHKTEKAKTTKKICNLRARTLKYRRIWDYSIEKWKSALEWWEGKCAYCEAPATSPDHFIPLKDENTPGTTEDNMLPACGSCNFSKQDVDPFRFASEESLSKIAAFFGWTTLPPRVEEVVSVLEEVVEIVAVDVVEDSFFEAVEDVPF
jgi:5-methylcytosine-specific restriction endonuclease McrA